MKKLTIGIKAFKCTMCGDAVYGRNLFGGDLIKCYCGNVAVWCGCSFSHHNRLVGSNNFDFSVKFPQTARICNVYVKIKPMPLSGIMDMFSDDCEDERNKYGRWTDPTFSQELRTISKAKMDLIRENES